ncbi:MAG: lytic murein transglycosylase [Myxococcota bacterium]|nr:lytic murein transglycosylase [Myxococcota bacterium]
MRAFLFALLVVCTPTALAKEPVSFEQWLTELKAEAKQRKFSETTLAALEGLAQLPEVIEKDKHQPEKKMTFEEYRKLILSEWRINKGRTLYAQHKELLDEVGAKYGVHPEYLVALWGVESAYGTRQGDFSILAALATLAHEGRRATFFRSELFSALKILEQGHATRETLKGSWAGAMGQCQFMPSTFLAYAADGNGDGRKDIWATEADVFSSAARYLSRIGWDRKSHWGQAVEVPTGLEEALFNQKLLKTLTEWRRLGVKTPEGQPIEGGTRKATLARPGGDSGPVYLMHANYHALMRWNRSKFFGAAVSLLAAEIVKPAPEVMNPPDAASGMTPDAGTR